MSNCISGLFLPYPQMHTNTGSNKLQRVDHRNHRISLAENLEEKYPSILILILYNQEKPRVGLGNVRDAL
jgi:hypothetical protein